MKRIGVIILAIFILSGCGHKANISSSRAETIAINNAGINTSDAAYLKSNLEYDDDRMIYDIEFTYGDSEYNYQIDAQDGSIVNIDKKSNLFTE